MNNTQFYLLLICVIVLFESIAQYHIKQNKVNNNMLYILIAIASYSINTFSLSNASVCLSSDITYTMSVTPNTTFISFTTS